jgi:hypothetical protein
MLHTHTVPGLLGAIMLLVGTAAGATDTPTGQPTAEPTTEPSGEQSGSSEAAEPEMERIVVSLPNGRKYVIERPKASAVADPSSPSQVVRVMADGSRISYGLAGGSGGKAAARRAPARSNGGNSKGVSRAGSGVAGGGGGGGTSIGGGGRSGGGGGGGGGGASGGGMKAGTAGSPSSSGAVHGARAPFQSPATQQGSGSPTPVPTIGSPRYDDDQATGGQDVTFFDAGISAMVLGRTVYIWGAEIVQSTEDFQLVEGERFAFDGAVARNHRPAGQTPPLTSANQLHAPLKLEFDAGATTTLTMFSAADNPAVPDRSIRNWTFRVR